MDRIARVRSFNRAVTQQIGALDTAFLGRTRSLGASRVLFEIGPDGLEVRRLRARLDLDAGYASRLLRGLEAEGLIRTGPAAGDARVLIEFGSGSSRKTSLLLDALAGIDLYVPIDVSGESLAEAAERPPAR